MIEYILITNNNKEIRKTINKIMMRYDYIYKLDDYSKPNINIVDNSNYKIYILDYSIKIIEFLKRIRYIENDWKSMIIIRSINIIETLQKLKEYMIIQITDNSNNYIEEGIIKALNNYDQHPNTLKYKYKNNYYNINLKDILYIENEKDSKRCIIYTKNNQYLIPKTLNNIIEQLDKRFIKCSRSFIVNLEQMISYNKKENIIYFENNVQITEISRTKKQVIVNYFRNVE